MPIKSYLAFPFDDQKELLKTELEKFDECQAIEAENKDLLVVITETSDEKEDEVLLSKIRNIEFLKHISLVSGFQDTEN